MQKNNRIEFILKNKLSIEAGVTDMFKNSELRKTKQKISKHKTIYSLVANNIFYDYI